MKTYIKPTFETVELRAEERFAGGSCAWGCCEVDGKIVWTSPNSTIAPYVPPAR